MCLKGKKLVLPLALFILSPVKSFAGNGANFVLYDHHTAEAGEMEVMLMNDLGQEPDGTRYAAQMVEFEVGITDRWTAEFMAEGQSTSGEGGYHVTGFRLESRHRLFEYGTFLNPGIYFEYESLGEDTKYLMEVSGREDSTEGERSRPRERVLETRLILGHDITERFDVALNWINESDLDTGVTAFGYAIGMNYGLSRAGAKAGDHMGEGGGHHPEVKLGLELFGALGDSDRGITADSEVTQHYLSPNVMFHLTDTLMVKLGAAVGLTNVSQDIFRTAIGYEF